MTYLLWSIGQGSLLGRRTMETPALVILNRTELLDMSLVFLLDTNTVLIACTHLNWKTYMPLITILKLKVGVFPMSKTPRTLKWMGKIVISKNELVKEWNEWVGMTRTGGVP